MISTTHAGHNNEVRSLYPVLETVQSALHFTSWQNVSLHLCKTLSLAAIPARKLFVHISTTVYSQVVASELEYTSIWYKAYFICLPRSCISTFTINVVVVASWLFDRGLVLEPLMEYGIVLLAVNCLTVNTAI